jgi:hypothetical protein
MADPGVPGRYESGTGNLGVKEAAGPGGRWD